MPTWASLLRVMLIFSLIVNGSGYALASAPMQMGYMPEPAAAAATEPAPASSLPCHEQTSHAAPAGAPMTASQDVPPSASERTADDCCSSGACNCDCTHAQATLPADAHVVVSVEHLPAACALQAGHIAPTLPHSMRPPIV